MRRMALLAVFVALLAVPGAQANGDPASDVLITQQVFLPFEAPISASAKDELTKTVASAKRTAIRSALPHRLHQRPRDRGQPLAPPGRLRKFLGSELAFVYRAGC